MEPVLLLILLLVAVTGIAVGVSLALVRTRRRRDIVGLEPPKDVKGVPDAVKQQVAEHKVRLLKELEERDGQPVTTVDEELQRAIAEAQGEGSDPGVVAGTGSEPVAVPGEPEALTRPRFRDRLTKARSKLSGMVGTLAGRSKIDEETWEEIEEALIGADVGMDSTQSLLDHLRSVVKDEKLESGEQLLAALKAELKSRLAWEDIGLH